MPTDYLPGYKKQDTKNRIQKKMRAHTEYCPHLIWLLLLKNKFLLSGIVDEYRYQQRYNTLRNHIMQLNMFVCIQKFGQGDSAARIELMPQMIK